MMALQWLLLAVLPAAAAECQAAAVIVSPGARVDSGREVKLTDLGGSWLRGMLGIDAPRAGADRGLLRGRHDRRRRAAGERWLRREAAPARRGHASSAAEAAQEFVAGPPEGRAARLRASDLATNYREAIEREGRRVRRGGQRPPCSAPRCISTSRHRRSATASSARRARRCSARRAGRAASGASTSGGRAGRGDRILLDFVLSRHRADVRHIAEFGTGGGITSFYLGGGGLAGRDAGHVDVVDARAPDVLKVELPSMRFHKADLAGAVANDAVDAAIRSASVVLVDPRRPPRVLPRRRRARGFRSEVSYWPTSRLTRGPGPTTHQAWASAAHPGDSRFYRDYGDRHTRR